MATNKAATKKATARKPAAAKTTVRTVRAETTKPNATRVVSRPSTATVRQNLALPGNIINIVLAELFGTFVLTLVALATFQETGALYIGLAATLLALTIGAISGVHINPAVTFGLWTMRRLKSVLVPFYWGAQLLGAILAVIITNWVSNNDIHLDFSHFTQLNWTLFGVEFIGTAVFLFGFAAAVSRPGLSTLGRALGIGTSLLVGLVVAGTLLSSAKTTAIATYQKDASAQTTGASAPEIPQVAFVKAAALNPAVALASTDSTKSQLTTGTKADGETVYSRLTLEVILGTLAGAAVGGNLYLLVAGRNKND